MKLYDLNISPFAARVRMQIRHKNLAVDICPPPVALRTAEFKAAYPLGRVPLLDLGKGTTIAESTAIMSYLEAIYPEPAMRPSSALACAHDDMLIRYTDNHMTPALSALFTEYFVLNQNGGEVPDIPTRFDLLKVEIEKLDRLLSTSPDFRERDLQLGDLCLATHLHYSLRMADYFGEADLLEGYHAVNDWHDWVGSFEAVALELREMDDAFRANVQ